MHTIPLKKSKTKSSRILCTSAHKKYARFEAIRPSSFIFFSINQDNDITRLFHTYQPSHVCTLIKIIKCNEPSFVGIKNK